MPSTSTMRWYWKSSRRGIRSYICVICFKRYLLHTWSSIAVSRKRNNKIRLRSENSRYRIQLTRIIVLNAILITCRAGAVSQSAISHLSVLWGTILMIAASLTDCPEHKSHRVGPLTRHYTRIDMLELICQHHQLLRDTAHQDYGPPISFSRWGLSCIQTSKPAHIQVWRPCMTVS